MLQVKDRKFILMADFASTCPSVGLDFASTCPSVGLDFQRSSHYCSCSQLLSHYCSWYFTNCTHVIRRLCSYACITIILSIYPD